MLTLLTKKKKLEPGTHGLNHEENSELGRPPITVAYVRERHLPPTVS